MEIRCCFIVYELGTVSCMIYTPCQSDENQQIQAE